MRTWCCLLLVMTALAGGCSVTRPGDPKSISAVSDKARLGNVYLLRGFMGWWSTGMDQITAKLNDAGVRAQVFNDGQWWTVGQAIRTTYRAASVREPLILIGHSYGSDDVLRIAQWLNDDGIPVELIITIDPVVPPKVPGNVSLTYNIYQPSGWTDALPWWRGIPLTQEKPGAGELRNVNIREERTDLLEAQTTHRNIDENVKVHAEILKIVLEKCPPRDSVATRPASPTTRATALR